MKKFLYVLMMIGSLLGAAPAHAVDGCKVLLCVSSNWSNIAQCRPDVEEAIRQVARGRGWPSCGMGGADNAANFEWTSAANCPVFYQDLGEIGGDSGGMGYVGCRGYTAVIRVQVKGAPWLDTFVSFSDSNNISTRYYPPARVALGASINAKYDNDQAAYVPPPPPPTCSGGDSC